MNPRTVAASSLVAAALSSPCAALAHDTFQAEAGLSYSRFKSDSVHTNQMGVDATYYFDQLPSRPDYPFEQAQFVERAASLGANYAWTSSDISGQDKISNGSTYGANLVFAAPDSPFIAAASYSSFTLGKFRDPATSTETESDSQAYQVSAGLYVAKTTDLALSWSKVTSDAKFNPGSTVTITSTSVAISGKHLMRLPGGDYIAFIAVVSEDTAEQPNVPSAKRSEYLLRATYYPTHMLGITAGVQVNRGDDRLLEGELYIASVRMFFTPTLSLSLDYLKFNQKAPGDGFDSIALRGAWRF